jgi:hypothetical protein
LSDQVPNTTTVYNTLFSGRDRIGGLPFVLIKVWPGRLGSVVEAAGRRVGTLGRVVMDAVFDPARFGGLPLAYRWIRDRKEDRLFLGELAECAIRYGDGSTCRRIGCALELLGAGGGVLTALRKGAGAFLSFIPLVPGKTRRGPTVRDWGGDSKRKGLDA